eukprot:scaffold674661_cov103-Prasinocladus_malaysianus.AAC.1
MPRLQTQRQITPNHLHHLHHIIITRTYSTAIAAIDISIADRGFTVAAMSHNDDSDQCSSSHCHSVYTANVALLLGRLAQ